MVNFCSDVQYVKVTIVLEPFICTDSLATVNQQLSYPLLALSGIAVVSVCALGIVILRSNRAETIVIDNI